MNKYVYVAIVMETTAPRRGDGVNVAAFRSEASASKWIDRILTKYNDDPYSRGQIEWYIKRRTIK